MQIGTLGAAASPLGRRCGMDVVDGCDIEDSYYLLCYVFVFVFDDFYFNSCCLFVNMILLVLVFEFIATLISVSLCCYLEIYCIVLCSH